MAHQNLRSSKLIGVLLKFITSHGFWRSVIHFNPSPREVSILSMLSFPLQAALSSALPPLLSTSLLEPCEDGPKKGKSSNPWSYEKNHLMPSIKSILNRTRKNNLDEGSVIIQNIQTWGLFIVKWRNLHELALLLVVNWSWRPNPSTTSHWYVVVCPQLLLLELPRGGHPARHAEILGCLKWGMLGPGGNISIHLWKSSPGFWLAILRKAELSDSEWKYQVCQIL